MDDYMVFVEQFYAFSGINLAMYKRPQMERRLTFLRNKHGYEDFQSFYQALRVDSDLLQELVDRMTINVSSFFRNPERWNALEYHLQSMKQDTSIRAWSAACSTGEEPYSLAMLLEERSGCEYEILATDMDPKVLQQAHAGIYSRSQTKSVPQVLLQKYFIHHQNSCQINSELRTRIAFRQHNLLSDPFPSSLDLIICRNVLIYFTEQAKEHVLQAFSRSLNEGGYLFLGSTEQILHSDKHGLRSVAPFLYQKYSSEE